ncbi:hypothetical protein [Kutzneria sp. 744]|uniref:hypothetical protein n=1 Tax=Kutzneria sp. (strain 744) TaxID=345341 RepID=UPI001E35C288|nr:hypothetical protein [Kutzneria sp. 744]
MVAVPSLPEPPGRLGLATFRRAIGPLAVVNGAVADRGEDPQQIVVGELGGRSEGQYTTGAASGGAVGPQESHAVDVQPESGGRQDRGLLLPLGPQLGGGVGVDDHPRLDGRGSEGRQVMREQGSGGGGIDMAEQLHEGRHVAGIALAGPGIEDVRGQQLTLVRPGHAAPLRPRLAVGQRRRHPIREGFALDAERNQRLDLGLVGDAAKTHVPETYIRWVGGRDSRGLGSG